MSLPDFEGVEVGAVAIKVTKAGDGLSEALEMEPIAHKSGETVCMVVKGKIAGIAHVSVKGAETLKRVETLAVDEAAVIDEGLLADVLDDQRHRIEAHKGVRRLDFVGDGPLDIDEEDGE